MKVKILRQCIRGGKRYNVGNIYNLGDDAARELVVQKLAEYADNPQSLVCAELAPPVDFVLVPAGGKHISQRRHYADHMAPVWNALPAAVRGQFHVIDSLADYVRGLGVEAPTVYKTPEEMRTSLASLDGLPVSVVCGHSDPLWLDRTGRRNIIMMHGVGFAFAPAGRTHTSYPGATAGRSKTVLMLSSNEHIAELERRNNPHVRVEVVGCPKLDTWHTAKRKARRKKPVIALAWHWRCKVATEANTAFDEYRQLLPELAKRYKLLGHGHPHIIDELTPIYESMGIPVVRQLADVFDQADLMVADATSAIFEFASLDRPVVFLRSKRWTDRRVGGMFADLNKLGVACSCAADVIPAIESSLGDPEPYRSARRAAVARAYAYTDGQCTERAAAAITDLIGYEKGQQDV